MILWEALQEFGGNYYEYIRNGFFVFSVLLFNLHFILLKITSLRKSPNALYHFTSAPLLENISKDGVLKAINYNLVFCTSNRDNSGSSNTVIKGKKGIVVFSGLALKNFKYNIRNYPFLSTLLSIDLLALMREEYCTIRRGDLVLTKMRRYNNMLIISEAEIKKVKFSLTLKREIQKVLSYIMKTFLFIITHLFSLAFIIDAFCHIVWFRNNFFPVFTLFIIILALITTLLFLMMFWEPWWNRKPHASITT